MKSSASIYKGSGSKFFRSTTGIQWGPDALDELMGKIKKHEEKRYFMIDGYMANKVLDKTEEITGIEKFDNRWYYFLKMFWY